jgi:membrane protein implicated in regulation of membrane protease activity
MSDRFHVGTFLGGAVLTITGAALAAVGFGWWDISSIDLRYVAPMFVILAGLVILLGALVPARRESNTETSA